MRKEHRRRTANQVEMYIPKKGPGRYSLVNAAVRMVESLRDRDEVVIPPSGTLFPGKAVRLSSLPA